jgi:hypothetical protein
MTQNNSEGMPGSESKLSLKYRLKQLNEKPLPLAGEMDDSEKTMQIVLPEEDAMDQTMEIPEKDIRIHTDLTSDQTMQIGGDDGQEDESDRTLLLPDFSQELDSDQTMMINFDKNLAPWANSDHTMMINFDPEDAPEEASDRTMIIDPVHAPLSDDESDRTMMIDPVQMPLSEDESDRTMMIDLDKDRNSLETPKNERTMLIHLKEPARSDSVSDSQSPSESRTERMVKVLKPGESKSGKSSLPLSQSKADESRHYPMGDPQKRIQTSRKILAPGGARKDKRPEPLFWSWTQTLHPTEGWLAAILCFPLSGLAFANLAIRWMLPDHPGPLPIVGSDLFVRQYVIPDLATGFLLWFVLAMTAQMIFSAAGGRPPLFWTLKIMIFSLLPFAMVRLGMTGLNLILTGPEAFVRGYRLPWVRWATPFLYTLSGAAAAFLLAKGAASQHCQAKETPARISFGMVPLIGLTGYLAFLQIQSWRFEQNIGHVWRRAETAWAESRFDEALSLLEEIPGHSRILNTRQKVRFYQMRGELRLQQDLVLQAREDFVRAAQILPPTHSENRLARAMNLLALERIDLARIQLTLAEEMGPESATLQRVLARMALGDFDTVSPNPAMAIDHARLAVALDPSPPNRALLKRTEDSLTAL